MPETDKLRLAFLDVGIFDNGNTIRGALLITDGETKPFEFRVTSPIRPSALQRVLYGSTLDEYVHVDLIGIPLIQAAKEEVNLVLVTVPLLLQIRPKVSAPIILLRHDPNGNSASPIEINGQSVKPLSITSHHDFPNEKEATWTMLAPLIQKSDLFEPFERLRVALGEAHKQNVGETPSKN